MKNSKRQDLPHGLWLISTPIGNLADVSKRICQALEQTQILLAEDTRRTRELLNALEIKSYPGFQLRRWDSYSTKEESTNWAKKIQAGMRISLVTDAGTPGLCDPGAQLVRACRSLGVRVIPVPGASAVSALLSVAGQETASPYFVFRGFFPRMRAAQIKEIQLFQELSQTGFWIWFESPHRLSKTAQIFFDTLPEAEVVLGKELTKVHERIFSGQWKSVFPELMDSREKGRFLGEWTFGVHPPSELRTQAPQVRQNSEEVSRFVEELTSGLEAGHAPVFLAKKLGHDFSCSRSSIYKLLTALCLRR